MYSFLFFIIVSIFAFLAWREKALNFSGAIGAIFVGTAIFIGTGIKGFILLTAFFVTSSFLSKWKREQKKTVEQIVAKGDARDWLQVLANGGIPALCSLFYYFQEDPLWIFAFAVSLACSTADTWASEIGVLSKKDPFLIFSFKRVRKGTSGAYSLLGTFAGFLGAVFIGFMAKMLWIQTLSIKSTIWIIGLGIIGMIVDSILGKYVQEKYQCTSCHLITEKKYHCGNPAHFVGGIRYVNNDAVNILSIFCATSLSLILF